MIKIKFVPILIICSIYFISFEINFSWSNFIRFFTYDILPWPIKKEGFYNNSYTLDFNLLVILKWLLNIIKTEGLIGIWNTIILTQIGLFLTGIFAFLSFPFAFL